MLLLSQNIVVKSALIVKVTKNNSKPKIIVSVETLFGLSSQ